MVTNLQSMMNSPVEDIQESLGSPTNNLGNVEPIYSLNFQ